MRRAAALLALGLLAAACGSASLPREVDVSRTAGPQNEVWAAVDPTNPDVLIAGSNDFGAQFTRGYTSTDGGRMWKVDVAPPLAPNSYFQVDPAVAIDAHGREYYAVLDFSRGSKAPYLYVSTRRGPGARWGAPVALDAAALTLAPSVSDDKDAIGVDGTRVYLAWTRFLSWTKERRRNAIVIARTVDRGRTWSQPVAVTSSTHEAPTYASIAAQSDDVYVAWQADFGNPGAGVRIAASHDGGRRFDAPVRVGRAACGRPTWRLLGAPETGVPPAPSIVFDTKRRRIDLAYGSWDCRDQPQARLAVLDLGLHTVADHVLGRGFFAVPAYDRATGDLWTCWYAMHDDIHTRYTCTVNFAKPRAAASVESDETGPRAAHGFSGREYGDYESVTAWNSVAHAFWTDSRNLIPLGEEIYTTTLKAWK